VDIKKKQLSPGIVVLEISESLRMGADCQRVDQEIDQLIRQNHIRVIFDLSGLQYIDSSGVGNIVRSLAKLKKSGGMLRLAGVQVMVQGVLKLTQVDRVIGIFPTALDASQSFPPASDR
jgi:anti-sigma B factor antagonist